MTTPWKQNCPHTSNGWCLECVSRLGDAIDDYLNNDGSRVRYDALMADLARMKIHAALINCELSDMPSTYEDE